MVAVTATAVMATVTIEVKRLPIVISFVYWLLEKLFFEHLSCCVLDCICGSARGKMLDWHVDHTCIPCTSAPTVSVGAVEQKRPLVGEHQPRLERWRESST